MEEIRNNIKNLYEERKKCIEEANYIKAEELTQKIKQYKNRVMEQHKRELIKKTKLTKIFLKKIIMRN